MDVDEDEVTEPDRFGGAINFTAFLVDEVRPELAKRYRLANDNTLFGFSAGGMFCETVLFTRPEAFDRYICGSGVANNRPDGGIFRLESEYAAKNNDLKAKLFLSVGELEAVNDGFEGSQLFTGVAQLAQIVKLRNYPSLEFHFKILDGEVHDWRHVMVSLKEGLHAVFPTKIPTDVRHYQVDPSHGRGHPALK